MHIERHGMRPTRPSRCRRDLAGLRFGKWVVRTFAGQKGTSRLWFCRCDCGTEKPVFEIALLAGRSTQCLPCSWKQRSGNTDVKSHVAWKRLQDLGALPLEWHDSAAFRKSVGDPPAENARLRRRDNAMPHGPGNTYWAIPKRSGCSRRLRETSRTLDIAQHQTLMSIRLAKTRAETIRRVITARSEGYTYESIGIAAGLSRQAVFHIVKRHGDRREQTKAVVTKAEVGSRHQRRHAESNVASASP